MSLKKRLQGLFQNAFERGTKEHQNDADRTLSGTYVDGYRNDVTTSTFVHKGLTVVSTQVKWLTMTPAADKEGKRYTFEVSQDGNTIFRATKEGPSTSSNFGAEERFIGKDNIPEQEWVVTKGELPKGFRILPLRHKAT